MVSTAVDASEPVLTRKMQKRLARQERRRLLQVRRAEEAELRLVAESVKEEEAVMSPGRSESPVSSASNVPVPQKAGSSFGAEDRLLIEGAVKGGVPRDRRWDKSRQMRQRSCPDALLDFENELGGEGAMDEQYEDFDIMVAAMERAPHTTREGAAENRFFLAVHQPLVYCRTSSGVSFEN